MKKKNKIEQEKSGLYSSGKYWEQVEPGVYSLIHGISIDVVEPGVNVSQGKKIASRKIQPGLLELDFE